jgi:hypothetical protein
MSGLPSRRRRADPCSSSSQERTTGESFPSGRRKNSHEIHGRTSAVEDPRREGREGPSDSALLAEQELREAILDYQRESGRMFPCWSEVLEVLQSLGYRKLGEESVTVDSP